MAKNSAYYQEKEKSQKKKLKELESLLPAYAVNYLEDYELNLQTSSSISYAQDLITFFRYICNENPLYKQYNISEITTDILNQLTVSDIYEYQKYLRYSDNPNDTHKNSNRSVAKKMACVRGLFTYCFDKQLISSNPAIVAKLPKVKRDKAIIRMENDEVTSLLNTMEYGSSETKKMSKRQQSAYDKYRLRDLAIATTLLHTGIRVSECVGLDISDIDFNNDTILVVRKGGTQDLLYLDDDTVIAITNYLNLDRNKVTPAEGHEQALFLSNQRKRISVVSVERIVKKYVRLVTPNKNITPHGLRRTYGTALYRDTGDIKLVADVLGHSNISTTSAFYAEQSTENKKRAAKIKWHE